jgi:AraC family transcriptional regulator of arabinose operon
VAVQKGELHLKLDGEKLHVTAGQAILLSPGHREHFLFSEKTETHHIWCAFQPGAVPPVWRKFFRAHRGPYPFSSRSTALWEAIRAGAGVGEATGPREVEFFRTLGLALLEEFALTVQEQKKIPSAADQTIAKAEDFISREFARPLQLGDVARAAGVSRQHLLKLFRQAQKPTPTALLYERRLDQAKDLLTFTGLSIGEIADRCGFPNAFHFSRRFRQHFGGSPRRMRNEWWGRRK